MRAGCNVADLALRGRCWYLCGGGGVGGGRLQNGLSLFPRTVIPGAVLPTDADAGGTSTNNGVTGARGSSDDAFTPDGAAPAATRRKTSAGLELPRRPRETRETLRSDLAQVVMEANACDVQLYHAAAVRFGQQVRRMHERQAAQARQHPQPRVTLM